MTINEDELLEVITQTQARLIIIDPFQYNGPRESDQ
jgi:hypothetical protein